MVRAGSKVIPHFAHFQNSNCTFIERGESAYHEQGKLDLYQWLLSQHISAKMEAYVENIQQRADILCKINAHYFAFEFQCASISLEILQKRTKSYMKSGIIPIWILGEKRLKKSTDTCLYLSDFEYHFFHQFYQNLPQLYLYNPQTKIMRILSNPYPIRNKVYGHIQHIPLQKLTIQQMFQSNVLSERMILEYWGKEKRYFRNFRATYLSKEDRYYLNWLYAKGLHPQYLPSIIHLPVSSQMAFQSNPYWWQSLIVLNVLSRLHLGERISIEQISSETNNLNKRLTVHGKFLKGDPVQEYLLRLIKLNIITKVNNTTYVKTKEIAFPKTMDDAMKQDWFIIKQLKDRIR